MTPIQMAKYDFNSAVSKIDRLIGSGRAQKYYNQAKELFKGGKGLFNDIKNDYSNPAMGRRRRRGRKMGKKRRHRKRR